MAQNYAEVRELARYLARKSRASVRFYEDAARLGYWRIGSAPTPAGERRYEVAEPPAPKRTRTRRST